MESDSGDARPEICSRPEHVLLLNLALPDPSASAIGLCRAILASSETLDWGFLIDQMARHRVLPAIARNFDRHSLRYPSAAHRDFIRSGLICNRKRNQVLGAETREVLDALERAELDVLVRKGPYLAHCLYPDPAVRHMSDLDLLIKREDADAIESVAARLGYRQGWVSDDLRTMQPVKRQELLFWKLNAASLPPFTRLTGIPEAEVFMIDLRHGLLEPSSRKQLDMGDWFSRATDYRIFGRRVRVPCPEDFIIDVSVHIYREATTIAAVNRQRDISLSRYIDLLLLIRAAEVDPVSFAARVKECGVAPETYYALHFLGEIYADATAALMRDMTRPESLGYLDEYGALDGHQGTWQSPFASRVFSGSRSREVGALSRLPGN